MSHWTFAFGWITATFVVGFSLMYLAGRQARKLGAWMTRGEPPKERAGAFLVVFALIGLVTGSLAQGLWDNAATCRAVGKTVLACLVDNQL